MEPMAGMMPTGGSRMVWIRKITGNGKSNGGKAHKELAAWQKMPSMGVFRVSSKCSTRE
jgi:hypothetical protein